MIRVLFDQDVAWAHVKVEEYSDSVSGRLIETKTVTISKTVAGTFYPTDFSWSDVNTSEVWVNDDWPVWPPGYEVERVNL